MQNQPRHPVDAYYVAEPQPQRLAARSGQNRFSLTPRTRLALSGVLSLLLCGLFVVLHTPAVALMIGVGMLLIIADLFNVWRER